MVQFPLKINLISFLLQHKTNSNLNVHTNKIKGIQYAKNTIPYVFKSVLKAKAITDNLIYK